MAVWTLLSASDVRAAAQILLECCPKLFDEFAKAWLNRFDTIDKLSGDESLLGLFVVGILKRLTMSRIEARHSWIRRFLRARFQTNAPHTVTQTLNGCSNARR